MSDLAEKKCIPCEGGIPSFKIDEIHKYLKKVDGWDVKPDESNLTIQLAGSEPEKYGVCAKIIESKGYDEINLNIGCPSDKVIKGKFGACLMNSPKLVADCILEIKNAFPDQKDEVIEEVVSFPNGDYDDFCDSATMALMRFRQGGFVSLDEDYQDEARLLKSNRQVYY